MNKLHLLIVLFFLVGASVYSDRASLSEETVEVVATQDAEVPQDAEADEERYDAIHPELTHKLVLQDENSSSKSRYSYLFSIQTAWPKTHVPPPRVG